MPRVVITGANGGLGRKLSDHLAGLADYDLCKLGFRTSGAPGIIDADLSHYGDWAGHFRGADAVVHLAAEPSWRTEWPELVGPNVDAVLNVGRACVEHRVERLVFASSNWVVAGHRFRSTPLDSATPPRPVNAYGAAKLFGERFGKHLFEAHGLSFVALRIGWVQNRQENRPGAHMIHGRWGQQMWLSDRDCCEVMRHAIEAPGLGFAVINAVSDNAGMRWDLNEGEAAIGWRPQDGERPHVPPHRRLLSGLKALQWRLFGEQSYTKPTDGW